MPEGRDYSDEEVEAILRRALEQQLESGGNLGHEDLLAAAREVGLDDASVTRAIAEISNQRSVSEIRRRLRKKRVSRWVRHLVVYLAVTAGLLALHALSLAGVWVLYAAIGWGVLVALQSYNGLRGTTEEEVEREQVRLNRAARRRAEAEARREAAQRKAEERARRKHSRHERSEAAEHLEQVVQEGVTLLLKAAARKLAGAAAAGPIPRTDFERYVARQKGHPPPPREHVKVRVEEASREEPVEEEREAGRARRRSTHER